MKYNPLSVAMAYSFLFLVSACKGTKVATRHAYIPLQQATAQALYQAKEANSHDLLHTKLEVSFDWQQQRLHGLATLKLQPHGDPQPHLVLDAQGFVVCSVASVEEHKKSPLEYTYDGKKLTIDLGKALPTATAYWVEIAYIAQPHEVNKSPKLDFFTNKGLFFINPNGSDYTRPQQIWTQGQPYNSYWLPTIDVSGQRCTQEFYITVDKRFKTLSNGVLGYSKFNEDYTRTDYWYTDLPHAPYLFMLAVGDFAVVQDEWNNLEVSYYVEPAYDQHVPAIFGHTPEMLALFSEKLAYPYPWPKYSQIVVRDYWAGAKENTSATVFADTLQVDDRQLLDQDYDDAIAQELFHQWFGDLVTCEPWEHLSLDHTLACIGAHIWREHKYGADAGDLMMWEIRQAYLKETAQVQVNPLQLYHHTIIKAFDSHSANKGALALHTLRQYIGEEVFFKALSHYLKKHAFSTVAIHQLRKSFEEVTGEDLNWFFDQWFLATSHPIVEVSDTYENGILTLKVWQKQNSQTDPIYKLPLAVYIWIAGEKQCHEIVVTQRYSEFTWTLPQRPELVYLDQRKIPAALIEHPKDAAAYQQLYYQEKGFFAKKEALTYCMQHLHLPTCYQVLQDALQDDFWFFRKIAIEALKGYKGQNLATVEAALINLSKNDSKPAVRAAAVHTLASLQAPAQYVAVYKQAMTDASYHVASTALYAYATTSNEPEKLACLAKFEALDNLAIVTKLASYYTAAQEPGKYLWLKEKFTKLQGRIAARCLIIAIGQYLAAITDKQSQEDGLLLFRQVALHTDRGYIKSAVCEALQQMQKIKDAQVLLSELKTHE